MQTMAIINNYIALLYFVLAKTKYKRADHMISQIFLSENILIASSKIP